MSETVWTNTLGDGDWNNNSNWSNQKPDQTHYPGILDGRASPPTQNLDRSADTVFRLIFTENYSGGIGGPSTPLKFNAIPGATSKPALNVRGTGAFYFEMVSGGLGDAIIDNPLANVTLDDETQGLFIKSGDVTIPATGTVGDICIVVGINSKLTIGSGASVPTATYVMGGKVVCNADYPVGTTSVLMVGGTFDMTGLFDSGTTIVTVGGGLTYRTQSDTSAKHTPIIALDGHFDARQLVTMMGANNRIIQAGTGFILGPVQTSSGQLADYNLREDYPGN
jgi:hypothetical protein